MCECIAKINAHLEAQGKADQQRSGLSNFPDGWHLETSVRLNAGPGLSSAFLVVTLPYGGENRKGNYKRVGSMRPNFCPFCGQKYEFPEPQDKAGDVQEGEPLVSAGMRTREKV